MFSPCHSVFSEASNPFSTSDCCEPSICVPHKMTQGTIPVTQGTLPVTQDTLAVTSAEPELKRTSFLANVAMFQNKFKGASLVRYSIFLSATVYSKTSPNQTLNAALKYCRKLLLALNSLICIYVFIICPYTIDSKMFEKYM